MAKSRKEPKFPITDRQLAQALGIDGKRLTQIEEFFASDPNDEWELTEGMHYRIEVKATNTRSYSYEGAYAIAKYLQKTDHPSFWERIKEWITHFRERLRRSLVKQKIVDVIEHPGKIARMNNRYFIAKKDLVAICCTSTARLNKAFEEIRQSSRPLIEGKDYADIDGVRYYSLRGMFMLSKHLGEKLTVRNRQEWCVEVSKEGRKTILEIIQWWEQFSQKVDSVKKKS